jgi:hypothetical protein
MFLESIKGNQVCKEMHEMNITEIDSGEMLFSNQLGDLGISNSPLSCSYFLIFNL